MSEAHIPTTFERRLRAKRAPHVVERTRTTTLRAQRIEPHALSNAHIPTTLRAQAASEASPTCSRTNATTHQQAPTTQHTHSADSERSDSSLRALSHHHLCAVCGCVVSSIIASSTAMQSLHISWKPLLACATDISLLFLENFLKYGRRKWVTWDNIKVSRAFPCPFRGNPVFKTVKMSFTPKAMRSASAAAAGPLYVGGCIASFGGLLSVKDGFDCSQYLDDYIILYLA